MSTNIRITGIGDTIKRLEALGGSFGDSLLKGAIYLRGVIAEYPPSKRLTRRSVYGRSFVSERQRRWFFASLNDGSLQIPYRRTHNLGHRWTARKESERKAIVGNNASYARYVQDEDRPQALFMAAIGWRTAQSVTRAEKEKVVREIKRDVQAQLRNRQK